MFDLLARLVSAALLALLFSQSAEFAQQYLQRLGGAADALGEVVARLDASAAAEGLTREAAIGRLSQAPDALVARQGRDAQGTVARYEAVSGRYRRLGAAAPLLRPFAMLGEADGAILSRTAEDFRPALPVTVDGLVLTLFGFAAGWGLGAGLAGTRRLARKRRSAA